MGDVLAVVADLMLASRVQGALTAAGHDVTTVARLEDARLDGVDLIVADLGDADPEPLAAAPAPVLGFHQHTDPDTKRRADEAGIELTVPRSRLVREMPELAARLIAGSAGQRD